MTLGVIVIAMNTDSDVDCNHLPLDADDGGKLLAAYSTIIFSNLPIDLNVGPRKGVLVICADRRDFGKEIKEALEEDSTYYRMHQRSFLVPFDVAHTKCPTCDHKLAYMNGLKQYLDRYAHLSQPEGWLDTKNQYLCSNCDKYVVFVHRTYLFVHSPYYVLNVRPGVERQYNVHPDPKLRKPEPIYKWILEPKFYTIRWDGNCMVCDHATHVLMDGEFGAASITGKMTLIGESICPQCFLIHHAEEHDD